ncbi:MAG: hypothetical protein ACI4BC_09750 [Muribaculaceae bacterium]
MEFILTFLAVFIGYYLVVWLIRIIRVGWKMRKAYKEMRDMAEQMGGGFYNPGNTSSTGNTRTAGNNTRRATRRNDSEYVEFEEIIEPRESVPAQDTPFNAEDWIEDAQFEEIIEKEDK